MLILHDPRCADYGSENLSEKPARVLRTAELLRRNHPDWTWRVPTFDVPDSVLLLAHTPELLRRLEHPEDFDPHTPYAPGLALHARRSVAAAIEAAMHAEEQRTPVFSLMRPPGHHATASEAMGFCLLNSVAIAALHAVRVRGLKRVAVWDFDAHHANGTEFILHAQEAHGTFFLASVHQYPGYPNTGAQDHGPSIRNWPVAPHTPRPDHLASLRASFEAVLSFSPELILISAGFDACAGDPEAELSLQPEDFATLGKWVAAAGHPVAAILEGGYSDQLPLLVDAFLSAWQNAARS